MCKNMSKKINLNESERVYEQERKIMCTTISVDISLIVSLNKSLIMNIEVSIS